MASQNTKSPAGRYDHGTPLSIYEPYRTTKRERESNQDISLISTLHDLTNWLDKTPEGQMVLGLLMSAGFALFLVGLAVL